MSYKIILKIHLQDDKSQHGLFGRHITSDEGTAIPAILFFRDVLKVNNLAIVHTMMVMEMHMLVHYKRQRENMHHPCLLESQIFHLHLPPLKIMCKQYHF